MRQVNNQCGKRRDSRCRLKGAVLLIAPLGLAILLSSAPSGGAGPASAEGKRGYPGEIVPVDSIRTLYVEALQDDDYGYCHETDDDAAEGFEEYDKTIEVQCSYGKGKAHQQSSIRSIFLTAHGYAYASGATGMGHDQWGDAESVFEVVFDSPVNQWCSLSGFISTTCDDMAGGSAVARLTGPDNVVLLELELSWENNTIEFSEGILLVEGGRYTLRVEAHAFACDSSAESEYSVLFDPTGYVPVADVGVYSVNSPQPEFPVGECTIAATTANYGSEGQQTAVHCDVFGQDVTFLDDDFEGDFPPPGWQQE